MGNGVIMQKCADSWVFLVGGIQSADDPAKLFKSVRDGRGNTVERATDLLLSVYQARCNLFHGGSPDDERDLRLVESSAEIMNGYLRALLSGL